MSGTGFSQNLMLLMSHFTSHNYSPQPSKQKTFVSSDLLKLLYLIFL